MADHADHADEAEAPLISNQHLDERQSIEDELADAEHSHSPDLTDVSLLLEKNLKHPGFYVWLLTFSAGISGLLFGCMLSYLQTFLLKLTWDR